MKCWIFAIFFLALALANSDAGFRLPLRQLPPPAVAAAITNGSSPLVLSSNRQSYYTVIKLGEINFRVALDTGSADLWVISSECASETCKALPRYPLAYSSPTFSAVENNATVFGVSYADGTAAGGFVAKETMSLAGMTLPQQAFGMVTESNISLVDLTSGVLGLGFPRLSSTSQTTVNGTPFFSRLAGDGMLAYPLFGISATEDGQGSLTFGAVDTAIVKNVSDIKWNDVVEFSPTAVEANSSSYLHWALPLTSLSVNGTVITPQVTYNPAPGKLPLALFDLGTSGIYGPHQDVEHIFAAIPSSRRVADGQWVIPCDYTGTISLSFGEEEYHLQPTDFLIGPAEGNPNLCLSWPVALPPSADGIDWQLGAPFLRTVYSAYSYGINTKESPKIGLYRLNNITTPESPEIIHSFLSSAHAQVPTTLPNAVLPSQTYTTPAYQFNTSVPAPTGGIVSSGLATSTFRPLIKPNNTNTKFNAFAIPTISPTPLVYTILHTDAVGAVQTLTSTRAVPSVTLGIPPGWSGAERAMGGGPSVLIALALPVVVSLFAAVFPTL